MPSYFEVLIYDIRTTKFSTPVYNGQPYACTTAVNVVPVRLYCGCTTGTGLLPVQPEVTAVSIMVNYLGNLNLVSSRIKKG